MAGDADEAHMCVLLFFYYCIYALGFHPTKEPISAKAKVAHNQRQEKKNGAVFFAFTKEDLPEKKSRMGSRKATIRVRTYASKPIRRVINRSRRVIERKIIHLRRKKLRRSHRSLARRIKIEPACYISDFKCDLTALSDELTTSCFSVEEIDC